MPTSPTSRHLLYVEDNPGDVHLLRTLAAELAYDCTVLEDGEEALQVIHTKPFRPDVIVLDVNIRKIDGFTVLAALKLEGELKSVPVLVIVQPQALNADLSLLKPLDWVGYRALGAGISGLCSDPAGATTTTSAPVRRI